MNFRYQWEKMRRDIKKLMRETNILKCEVKELKQNNEGIDNYLLKAMKNKEVIKLIEKSIEKMASEGSNELKGEPVSSECNGRYQVITVKKCSGWLTKTHYEVRDTKEGIIIARFYDEERAEEYCGVLNENIKMVESEDGNRYYLKEVGQGVYQVLFVESIK